MSYRVIVDSCGELTLQMKESGIFKTASLSMEVDGFHILDDETFDQADFFKKSGCKRGVSEVILSVPGALYGIIQM